VSDDDNGNGDGDSEEEEEGPNRKRPRTCTLLRIMFHDTLSQQFGQIEAVYEARKVTFEIKTDAGLDSGSLAEGEELVCNVAVEFEEGNDFDAKITVECSDSKLRKNVQECLKSVAEAAAPVKV